MLKHICDTFIYDDYDVITHVCCVEIKPKSRMTSFWNGGSSGIRTHGLQRDKLAH